jgi:hypothetical protein
MRGVITMKKNVGKTDKTIRYILALVFVYLGYTGSSWWYLLAIISAATAYLGKCGLYKVLGINTCKHK